MLSITSNLQFFPLGQAGISFPYLRWSFLLVFSRGCSTYLLLLYGEGNDLGKKAKSCIISDKNAALVPISEFFLHLYIEQSWVLTLSPPFLKCHLAQVISEREEIEIIPSLRWSLGQTPFALWKVPLGECSVLCLDCHISLRVPAHC